MVRIDRHVTHPSNGGDAWSGRAALAGRTTRIHVATYDLSTTRVVVERMEPPRPVAQWCADRGFTEAINGGFFAKPEFEPLGRLIVDGVTARTIGFRPPWDQRRAALRIDGGDLRIGPLQDLPAAGRATTVLQAAPLLVADGRVVVAHDDPEGLATTCDEFDSDITADPYPRMAFALGNGTAIAASADGRAPDDDGFTLPEWADVLVALGARWAINLDGGSSSALVTAGRMRNLPRDDEGELLADGYPTSTVIGFRSTGVSER